MKIVLPIFCRDKLFCESQKSFLVSLNFVLTPKGESLLLNLTFHDLKIAGYHDELFKHRNLKTKEDTLFIIEAAIKSSPF